MTISIYHSNKLEILLDMLIHSITATEANATTLDPFIPELILVPQGAHGGVARWVTHNMAISTGIAAQLKFATPAAFFTNILDNISKRATSNQGNLAWRIMRKLSTLRQEAVFAIIDRYLGNEPNDTRQFALAQQIAQLFEKYALYATDMVLAWEAGQGDDWQAALWRTLFGTNTGQMHWGQVLSNWQYYASILSHQALPCRISLFNLQDCPPVYVQTLQKLAAYMEIQVFVLNPSRDAWVTYTDASGKLQRTAQAYRDGEPAANSRLHIAHPLLATWGHKSQALLNALVHLTPDHQEIFTSTNQTNLLHKVQDDILNLRDLRNRHASQYANLDPNDLSIQIHACHSPLREIQVLHDQLLRLFATTPELHPQDVVIMAPNMDVYANYIEAVFSTVDDNRRIPYAIAKRATEPKHLAVITSLRFLLQLPASRFAASQILSLLHVPAIQRRFKLDNEGIERIHTWVAEAGICWGMDATQRAALQLPKETANTWEFGLQRLFLGMALTPDTMAEPFLGVAPYPDIEGGEVEYLGSLQAFINRLNYWQQYLQSPRSLGTWRAVITSMCDDLFAVDEDEGQLLHSLFTAFADIETQANEANFTAPISVKLCYSLLNDVLDAMAADPLRLLSGKVTFCSLHTMSSIPHRIVCLLGLNGVDFPPSHNTLSFDLLQQPKLGNPSVRDDSKALFLNALLAARDCFYISYIGRDLRNNEHKNPAVMVNDMLDYIYGCVGAGPKNYASHIHITHALQPFSPSNFDRSKPQFWSYASEWLEAARSHTQLASTRFLTTPLQAPDEVLRTVELEDLIKFLINPAAYFLTQRLKINLPRNDTIQPDLEPFELNNLQQYLLENDLLPLVQAGWDEARMHTQMHAKGILPHGAMGALVLKTALKEVQDYAATIAQYAALTPSIEPVRVDLPIGNFCLQGWLTELRPTGLVCSRLGNLRGKNRLRLWVQHLVLCALQPPGVALYSTFIAKDNILQLTPVANPLPLLEDLLTLRWQGLSEPLKFFPDTALAYYNNGGDLDKARSKWDSADADWSESNDSAVRIAFRGLDPIDEDFAQLAERIIGPMQLHTP